MYVPDVTTVIGEAAVFRDLDAGHAPRPEHSDIIRSAGAAGLLMRFSRPSMVGVALHALHHPPRPPSPGAVMQASVTLRILRRPSGTWSYLYEGLNVWLGAPGVMLMLLTDRQALVVLSGIIAGLYRFQHRIDLSRRIDALLLFSQHHQALPDLPPLLLCFLLF